MPPQSSGPLRSGDGSRAVATIEPPPGARRAVVGIVLVLVAVVAAGLWGRSKTPAPPAPTAIAVRSAAPTPGPRPFALTVVNASSSPDAQVVVNLHRVAVASCAREPVVLRAGAPGLPPLPWTVYATSIREVERQSGYDFDARIPRVAQDALETRR